MLPPRRPPELWLVGRELIENLEERKKFLKGFSCPIIRQFNTVDEALKLAFYGTQSKKLKVIKSFLVVRMRKIVKPFVSYELPGD